MPCRPLVESRPPSRPAGRRRAAAAARRAAARARACAQLAALDASGQYADAGAPSAAVWLRRTLTVSEDTARAAVKLAVRVQTELPALGQALVDGETTLEHVRAVAAGVAGLDPQVVAESQEALVDLVAVAAPGQVRQELRERAEAIDPRLAAEAERKRQDRQGLYLDQVPGGSAFLGGQLAPEAAAVVLHGLDLQTEADRTAGDTRSLPGPPRRGAGRLGRAGRPAAARRGRQPRAGRAHRPDPPAGDLHRGAAVRDGRRPGGPAAHRPGGSRRAVRPGAGRAGPAADRRERAARRAAPAGLRQHAEPGRAPAGRSGAGRRSRRAHGAADGPLAGRARGAVAAAGRHRPGPRQPRPARDQPARAPSTRCGSAGPPGPSPPPSGAPWSSATGTARCVAATADPPSAKRTTSGTGSTADPTDLDNLVLLCHQHHHDHHDRGHDLQHHDGRWITADRLGRRPTRLTHGGGVADVGADRAARPAGPCPLRSPRRTRGRPARTP